MIMTLSTRIVAALIRNKVLESKNHEYYVYGLTCRIEQTIFVICMWLISIPFGSWRESPFFLGALYLLRKHTGGYHVKSFSGCIFASTAIVVIGYAILPFASMHYALIVLPTTLISSLIIFRLGAIDHPAYSGTSEEMHYHRTKAKRHILVCASFVVIATFFPMLKLYGAYASYACLVTSVLMLLSIREQASKEF